MHLIFFILFFPIVIFAQNITIAVDAIHGQEQAIRQW